VFLQDSVKPFSFRLRKNIPNLDSLGADVKGEPLCTVNFQHFARFAEYWLEAGTGLPADLYEDDFVDLFDLELFVYEWLYYCPYNWPLKQ